jgi:hypothetical protein
MGREPVLDFCGFVDLGVVSDDREMGKEQRGVRPIKCLQ